MLRRWVTLVVFVAATSFVMAQEQHITALVDYTKNAPLRGVAHDGDSTIVVVGSMGTILRSTDGGKQWTTIPTSRLYDLYDVVYVGSMWLVVGIDSSAGGLKVVLLESEDAETWNVGAPSSAISSINVGLYLGLEFVRGVDDDVFLVTSDGAIVRSTDRGQSWTHLGVLGTQQGFRRLFLTASSSTTFHAVVDQTYWRTTDAGATWNIMNTSFTAGKKIGIGQSGDTLMVFVAVASGTNTAVTVNRSLDGGDTWTVGATTVAGSQVERVMSFGDGLLVGLGGWQNIAITTSTDGGNHWDSVSTSDYSYAHDVALRTPTSFIVCGTRKSIYIIEAGASTATTVSYAHSRGVDGLWTFREQRDGSLTYSVSLNGTFLRSTDDGATWKVEPTVFAESGTILDVVYHPDGSATALTDVSNVIYHRSSPESDWSAVPTPGIYPQYGFGRLLSFGTGQKGLFLAQDAERNGGIALTSDAGQTWTSSFTPQINIIAAQYVEEQPGDAIVGITRRFDSGTSVYSADLVVSHDNGETWTVRPIDDEITVDVFVAFDTKTIVAAARSTKVSDAGFGRLYSTTDGGETWTNLLAGRRQWIGTLARQGDTCVAGSKNSDTLFVSVNKGVSWSAVPYDYTGRNGHRTLSFRSSFFRNGVFYGNGVFGDTVAQIQSLRPVVLRIPLFSPVLSIGPAESSINEVTSQTPDVPTPVYSNGAVTWQLENTAPISITIYDLQGRHIFTTSTTSDELQNGLPVSLGYGVYILTADSADLHVTGLLIR